MDELQGRPAGVANLDHIAGLNEIEEPSGVLAAEVEAAAGEVGVALRPQGVVEMVQIDAVGADPGGPADLALVADRRPGRHPVGCGVHGDGLGLVEHRVDPRRGPPGERLVADGRGATAAHRGWHGPHQPAVVEDADLLGDVVGNSDVGVANGEAALGICLTVEALTEFEAEHVGIDADPGAGGVEVLRSPVRDVIADPVPRTGDRGFGPHDEVLLRQRLVGDRLVEVGAHHGADAVTLALLNGEPTLHLQVRLGVVVRDESGEGAGAGQRDATAALAVNLQCVGPGEVQSLGRRPGRAISGYRTLDGVAPVVVQRDRGDLAVHHVHLRSGQRVDALGFVERGDSQQRRLRRGRQQ